MKNKYLCLILICLFVVIHVSGSRAQNVSSDEISIAIPVNVITNMIKASLPLNLEESPYLKGTLWIHTIDQLKIGSNTVAFDVNIRGKNIKLETQLGNQALSMDIGNFSSVFSCNASLRYDGPKRILYITPYILQKQNENETDKRVLTLLQLLSLANGVEYPIEIKKFQPFVTQINSERFHIDLDITNIYTEDDKVLISGQPQLKKIKSPTPSKKKPD